MEIVLFWIFTANSVKQEEILSLQCIKQKKGRERMREIKIDLLSKDAEKLAELARKDGFHSSAEYARKVLEDKIRMEYRRRLS